MSIASSIKDGRTGRTAIVDEDNALLVKSIPIPTVSARDDQVPFSQLFTSNGMTTGSSNMNVNGSVTAQEFKIISSSAGDRYITNIAFTITDQVSGNVSLDRFGGIAALANGVKIFFETEQGRTSFQQGAGIQTNFELIRLCLGVPAFGSAGDAFKLSQVYTNEYGFFPVLNIQRNFGFQWGIRLRQSQDQKIVVQINDDLTGVARFTAFATGFDLTPLQS